MSTSSIQAVIRRLTLPSWPQSSIWPKEDHPTKSKSSFDQSEQLQCSTTRQVLFVVDIIWTFNWIVVNKSFITSLSRQMGTRTPILLRPHWILNNQLTLPLLAVEADGRTRIRGLMQMFVPITIFLDTLFADNAGFTTRLVLFITRSIIKSNKKSPLIEIVIDCQWTGVSITINFKSTSRWRAYYRRQE